ncbi:hypothetical protein [Mucisphaera sp.]|uniref:hypothetical protein n=1 Tax=Mucisphaera sp. TaxID=2913024 RepID=UPI003D139BB6
MRPATCLLLSSVLILATGCDPAGGPGGEARQQIDEVLVLFEQANAGFIPQNEQQPGLALKDYRLEKLFEARTQLTTLTREGTEDTRARALRLLSDIEAARARLLVTQATATFADIGPQGVQALGLIDAAEKAASRIGLHSESLAQAADDMDAQAAEFEQQAQQVSAELATHQRERDRLSAERERVRSVYETAIANQVDLINRSSLVQGDDRYELLEEAARSERRASLATTETERFDSQIFTVETRLGQAQAKLRGLNETAAALRQRAAATRETESARQTALALARQQAVDAVDQLLAAGSTFTEAYETTVESQLATAIEAADEALGHVNQSRRLADRDAATAIDFERVAKGTERAHTAAIRVSTLSDYADILAPINDALARLGQTDQPVAAALATAAERIQTTTDNAAEPLQATIDLANQLAERFDETTREGRLIRRQIARLEAYVDQLGF